MIKILFHMIHYPFALGHYFLRALDRRADVEVFTVGAYTGSWTPWGMNLPQKYLRPVDLPLPSGMFEPTYDSLKPMLPWKPDLVLQLDAGAHFITKPKDGIVATVATDPHVLDYNLPRSYSDYFFNMQKGYSKVGDIFLPYACDPFCHYPDLTVEETMDACLVGLHYGHRNEWVNRLRAKGYKVTYEIGPIYDEYRQLNCGARVGLNWSSLLDVNARFYELSAMKCRQVCNRLPDMEIVGFKDMEHYIGFTGMDEAVAKVEWALTHLDEARQIGINAYEHVMKTATYDMRVEQILKTCGLV